MSKMDMKQYLPPRTATLPGERTKKWVSKRDRVLYVSHVDGRLVLKKGEVIRIEQNREFKTVVTFARIRFGEKTFISSILDQALIRCDEAEYFTDTKVVVKWFGKRLPRSVARELSKRMRRLKANA